MLDLPTAFSAFFAECSTAQIPTRVPTMQFRRAGFVDRMQKLQARGGRTPSSSFPPVIKIKGSYYFLSQPCKHLPTCFPFPCLGKTIQALLAFSGWIWLLSKGAAFTFTASVFALPWLYDGVAGMMVFDERPKQLHPNGPVLW